MDPVGLGGAWQNIRVCSQKTWPKGQHQAGRQAGRQAKKKNSTARRKMFSGCVDKCSKRNKSGWGRGIQPGQQLPTRPRCSSCLQHAPRHDMAFSSTHMSHRRLLDASESTHSSDALLLSQLEVTLCRWVRRAAVAKLVDSLKNCFRTAPSNCIWCDRPQNASSPT